MNEGTLHELPGGRADITFTALSKRIYAENDNSKKRIR